MATLRLNRYVLSACRVLWSHKLATLAVCSLLYVCLYVALGAFPGVSKTTPIGLRLREMSVDYQENFLHPNYWTFNNSQVRLHFKEIPATLDDPKSFKCTQKNFSMSENETEDIVCYRKPKYLEQLKNPCYTEAKTNALRCMPYFHLLGVDKCGTTNLFSKILKHPEILSFNKRGGKELYYWGWLRYGIWMKLKVDRLSLRKYLMYFNYPAHQIEQEAKYNNRQIVIGEGTPMDFWDFRAWRLDPQNKGLSEPRFLVPHAMKHIYRKPKFLVVFRDPVERIYSDYLFLGYGWSAKDFARDVPVAIERMKTCLKHNTTRQCFFSYDMYMTMNMRLHVSCYSIFLREWFSVFSREHFLFLRTEDMYRDTAGVLTKVFRFLEVDDLSPAELARISGLPLENETNSKKKAGLMFKETRLLLEEFFAPFNKDLAYLLKDNRYLWGSNS